MTNTSTSHPGSPADLPVIGFIGLGIMGAPMAANLVKAGYQVVAFNRSPEKTARLVELGGRAGASVREVAEAAQVLVTMLPDSPDVEAVLLGDDGALSHLRPGGLVIDMSTVSPATAQRVAEAASGRQIGALDAPVSGGEQGAIEATLSIMVGGDAASFERAKPVFEALGSTIVHVGPVASGQIVKAANQLIVAGTIALVAEALVLLGAYDVDLQAATSVLAGGLAGSLVLNRKAPMMIAHEFKPGFRIELHHKDLGIVSEAARSAQVVLPVGAIVTQLMAAAKAQGLGSLDHSGLFKVIEGLSARE